jgi:hypothetical protein
LHKLYLASLIRPLFYGFAIVASISPILYWMVSPLFAHIHKVFFYGILFVMVVNLIQNRYFLQDNLILFLVFYSILIITLGLSLNDINKATFAHLQPIFLPVLGISFGYLIAKVRPDILATIYDGSYRLGLILSLIIIIYYLLYHYSFVTYFGASSLIFIPIFWAFLEKKWLSFTLFVVILLFTGKRSATIAIFAVILLSSLRTVGVKRFFFSLFVFLPIILVVAVNLFGEFPVLYERYELIFNALMDEEIDLTILDTATSGRVNDFMGVVYSLNKDPFFWFFGKGIGALFDVDIPSGVWTTHYSHFTPISYIFLGGWIMFLAVYGKLISLLIYCLKNMNDYYSMFFVYYFITSFIGGAIYFTDPFIWMFTGVIVYQKKWNRKAIV